MLIAQANIGFAGDAESLARDLVSRCARARNPRGICLVLNGGDLSLALAKESEFLVVAQESDFNSALELNRIAYDAGLLQKVRFRAVCAPLERLVMAARTVDLLIAPQGEYLENIPVKEWVGVLAPGAGEAMIHSGDSSGLRERLKEGGLQPAIKEGKEWVVVTRPRLAGGDEWTHRFHRPDNNLMSRDTANRPPYALQWLGDPVLGNQRLQSLACAGGIIFDLQNQGKKGARSSLLRVRDANNSRLLWRKTFSTDSLSNTSCMIAADDKLFLRDNSRILVLDPLSGAELKVITPDERPGVSVAWMLYSKGVLYVLSGTRAFNDEIGSKTKNIFFKEQGKEVMAIGNRVTAWDVASGARKWQLDTGDEPIDGQSMALNNAMLFFGSERGYVCAVSLDDGKQVWRTDFTDGKLKEILGKVSRGSTGLKLSGGLPTVRVSDKWVGVGFQSSSTIVVLDAESGTFTCSIHRTSNSWAIDGDKLYVARITKALQKLTGLTDESKYGAVYSLPSGKFEDPVPGYGILRCSQTLLTPTTYLSAISGPTYDRLNKCPVRLAGQYFRGACWQGNTPIVADGLHFVKGNDSCCCFHTFRGFFAFTPSSPTELNPPRARFEPEYLSANPTKVEPLAVKDDDWYASRGGYRHQGFSPAKISLTPQLKWRSAPALGFKPPLLSEYYIIRPPVYHNNEAITAGDLVFTSTTLGSLSCLDAKNGKVRWQLHLGARIFGAPVVVDGRVFVGTGDGYVYAYEAVSGRPLWRFRTAPEEQLLMIYGYLQSRWPTTGILVKDNVLYAAAGMAVENKLQVYALEADTGKLKWHNDKPEELYSHEGPNRACAIGGMTIIKDQLWVRSMYTPCVRFDINTGKTIPLPERLDKPENRYSNYADGPYIGVIGDSMIMQGGRPFFYEDFDYSCRRNQYFTFTELDKEGRPLIPEVTELLFSCVMPAWDDKRMLVAPYDYNKRGAWNGSRMFSCGYHRVSGWDVPGLFKDVRELRERYQDVDLNGHKETRIHDGYLSAVAAKELKEDPNAKPLRKLKHPMTVWGPEDMVINSLALAANAALVVERTTMIESKPGHFNFSLLIKDRESGKTLKTISMPGMPGHNSLSIGSKGNIYIAMQDGSVACYGE